MGRVSREQTENAFRQCVLSLCDVQFLTGISLLIGGFISLSSLDNLALADWRMIINLAWFSNITHQCGLIFLREYLYQNPSERKWRLVFMAMLLIALLAAMVPTAFAVQFDTFYGAQEATPAACFYNSEVTHALYEEGGINKSPITRTGPFQISMASICILFLTFVTRLIKLFETSSRLVRDRIRAPIGYQFRKLLTRCVKARSNPHGLGFRFRARVLLENLLLTGYMFLRICADTYASRLSDVCWVLLSAIFGTKHLAVMRAAIIHTENDKFDFGQVLPVVLLIGPVLTIRQSFMARRLPPSLNTSVDAVAFPDTGENSPWSSLSSASTAVPDTTPVAAPKTALTADSWTTPVTALNNISELDGLLNQDSYMDAVWFVPTLLNIAAAIFLFFQLIASSGFGTAVSLTVSIAYSFLVVSFSCCAVILVGLTLGQGTVARLLTWFVALQSLAATALLAHNVMQRTVSFGEMEEMRSMFALLGIATGVFVAEYGMMHSGVVWFAQRSG
ncbi:hypothetical protein DL768_006551 [Monosporascus sp. mg162]|nr:hypothetical protein DL768_006551 [Monosporascus sp. mg162]